MKIRIKFSKTGVMKYVGHLDLMRYFQKAIRRAGLDIRYSEGYSPHMIMSFAAPLGIGMTSEGEYLDIEVNSTLPSAGAIAALNEQMAEGMQVFSYVALDDHARKAMSIVCAADYQYLWKPEERDSEREFYARAGSEGLSVLIDRYYNREHIEVKKKTKKSERIMNIRPLIFSMKKAEEGDRNGFFLKLNTGSTDNIKPELVLEDFFGFYGMTFDRLAFDRKRLEVYGKDENGLAKPLGLFGQEIV